MTAAALPCVEVGVATLCEQVHNGRSTNFKCTACQPTLRKKLKLFEFEEKPHCVLGKNHADEDKETSRCALDEKDYKDFDHADEGATLKKKKRFGYSLVFP